MKPIQIEVGTWYFKGCFIQEQSHPQLDKYLVFKDTVDEETIGTCSTFAEAKNLCKLNEVKVPYNGLQAYLY